AADEVDAAGIRNDQLRTLAQPALHLRCKHGMPVGRVCADDEDHVGFHDRIEVLRSGRLAECLLEAVTGRRMADARARIDVVIAEAGSHQLLYQVGFLVAAAGRGDAADRIASVLGLNPFQLAGGVGDGFLPRYFAPRIADLCADHRLQNTVRVRGVADGEAALDTRVTMVRMPILVRDHAHEFLALHFGAERATNTAISAGRDDAVLGLALLDQCFLGKGGSRTGLHAGTARNTLRVHERLVLARRNLGLESAALDGQRERALLLVTRAYAA